jgi:hypothetical protein
MSIHFRGGDLQQKGKGIGGFFRNLLQIFRPLAKNIGGSIVKAASSDTAKSIAKTLGEQALDSGMNMTRDFIQGNDLKDSFNRERESFKRTGTDVVNNLQSKMFKKRKLTTPKQKKVNAPKKRKVTLKTMKKYESRPY